MFYRGVKADIVMEINYAHQIIFKAGLQREGGWNVTVLHSFRNHPSGNPAASLIFDAAGNLYGNDPRKWRDSLWFGV
jgi:hypothetical protein